MQSGNLSLSAHCALIRPGCFPSPVDLPLCEGFRFGAALHMSPCDVIIGGHQYFHVFPYFKSSSVGSTYCSWLCTAIMEIIRSFRFHCCHRCSLVSRPVRRSPNAASMVNHQCNLFCLSVKGSCVGEPYCSSTRSIILANIRSSLETLKLEWHCDLVDVHGYATELHPHPNFIDA